MSLSKPYHIDTQGLVLPGHADHPAHARAAAESWLKAQGMAAFYAAAHTEAAPVMLAWVAGGDFVQEDYAGAEPVTVVLVPKGDK